MTHPKLKIHNELKDLFVACWKRSRRLTAGFTIFLIAACVDEVLLFTKQHGTVYHLWEFIKTITSWL